MSLLVDSVNERNFLETITYLEEHFSVDVVFNVLNLDEYVEIVSSISLRNEVRTRWWSCIKMLEKFFEHLEAIKDLGNRFE